MKKFLSLFGVLLIGIAGFTQTYVELTDNMEIPSNSNIKILGGDYVFADYNWDGVIQIVNKENIILDGDSVTVTGDNCLGYMINIENSNNIIIKNFDLVKTYKYAVRAKNSHDIKIEANNFSYNKKDTIGWIQIWTTVTNALGGGVLFDQCSRMDVYDNTMIQQNDGVAMYECDSAHIFNNTLNWNCGFGVRMNFTDYCHVHHNDCSHINRETDPSDCAAILLIVSNHNTVEYNNLSYSGDGVFLGQYQYSQIPNNNYFAYNYCSYSPHNAIEATFADGNIYKHNICNYSHYGFWLGYSFNSIVDSNEVIGNQHWGIAIDRGFNNTFTNNEIKENAIGISLWEGDPIPPYQDQKSHDYVIKNNLFEGNEKAISAEKTEHLIVQGNHFLNNRTDIYFEGESFNDTITDNIFEGTATFYFENRSTDDIFAVNNDFIWNDTSLIECKIYDKNDYSYYGEVIWQPFVSGIEPYYQHIPPEDMAEPDALWNVYPEACWAYGLWEPTTVEWDYEDKMVGEASVHISTGNGWDLGAMYRPGNGSIVSWNLTEQDSLVVWFKSINNTGYGFQYCHIKLGNNCGGYYKYTASASTILNPTIGQWKQYKIPLAGGAPWSRTFYGDVSLADISYVEFHADTWEYGFELWIDGVTFTPFFTEINGHVADDVVLLQCYPNPVNSTARISYKLSEQQKVNLSVFNIQGKLVRILVDEIKCAGSHATVFSREGLPDGVYFYSLKTVRKNITRKLIITE